MEIYSTIPFAIALIGFILFFFPTRYQKYFGIVAWTAAAVALATLIPNLIIEEGNFFYPIIIVLILLLMIPTFRLLLKENEYVYDLTRGAGVALIVYAPFQMIPALGNWLIGTVVFWIQTFFNAVGFPYQMYDWNTFQSVLPGTVGYGDTIILGCTGITAIAILVGVIFLTKTTPLRKLGLLALVIIPIYIINIFRNIFVIVAYFEQWFPYGAEWFVGNPIPGFASYFWSHNVICEGGAFVIVIIIAILLFKFTPGLVATIRNIFNAYRDEIKLFPRRK